MSADEAAGKVILAETPTPAPAAGTGAGEASSPSFATFQLPPGGYRKGQIPDLPHNLEYQYGYGSESEATYRVDLDLDRQLDDDSLVLIPELNGYVVYRPADWVELTLEMILEREIPVIEEDVVVLPNGEIVFAEDRRFSLLVDQAFVKFKSDPFELSLGRKNFEDLLRHWLYDTSMDIAQVSVKHDDFRTNFMVGRE